MAYTAFQLRSMGCALALGIVWVSGCSKKPAAPRGESGEIELNQNVTVSGRPLDPVFKDFDNNWRQFVSDNPRLTLAVLGTDQRRPPAVEPIIVPECIFSESIKGFVPRVTVTWNEAAGQSAAAARFANVKSVQQTSQEGQTEIPAMRFDLGLHHDPFTRNFFSSALSTDVSKRFSLPSNSALLTNPEAVRLTGPGLFPKLLSVRTQVLQDAATNLQINRTTVAMQELNQGLSYQMRVSRLANNQWAADQLFVFMSPVCQTSF
jgi:hypothetical protein